MITITMEFTAEGMLLYLCVLATAGLILKAWQLFGSPNK